MALDMQSVYILASGGSRAMEQLDTTTNNLANVNTDGFKKMMIKEMSQRLDENGGDANHLFVFPRFQESLIQNSQGALKETQNPLDFAIEGEGFFKIELKGEILYTRNGHFFLDAEGYLVDKSGGFVLDGEDKKIKLDPDKPVNLTKEGVLYQEDQEVAKIAVENFSKTTAVGDTYYKPASKPVAADFRLHQGFKESSNVNAVAEMSSLIVAQRRFEIYSNLIKSLDQLNQKTNDIAKA